MDATLARDVQKYAELLVTVGLNIQAGQPVRISAEIAHRGFVRQVAAAAYEAGAKYVQIDWIDTPALKQRFLHSRTEFLGYFPGYEIARHEYMLEQGWARLSLVGAEYPEIFDDVDATAMRRTAVARSQALKFYMDKMMANQVQWCVAGVPTRAWAKQVFPDLAGEEALQHLWRTVLRTCRVDREDPRSAWLTHDEKLNRVVAFLDAKEVRSVRFVDSRVDEEGMPLTDLSVGLTDAPVWLGAGSKTPDGTLFFANMPTEEVFTTPHSKRTEGWVRISKPAFPFEREVHDALFRFGGGQVIEYDARIGKPVLDEFFEIEGAKRLGEVALVDISSPINRSGLIFYETLYDENATCHIAFGNAYPDGIRGGSMLSSKELAEAGANQAPAHVDMMIGTETMNVFGESADGTIVTLMENGRFTVFDEEDRHDGS